MNDYELLRKYARDRSDQAFACLMERHMQLVYRTCSREIGDRDLARDAAQATFLVLAQKAPELRRRTSLAAWLFTVARMTARNAARAEAAHQGRVRRAGELAEHAALAAASWSRIEPLVIIMNIIDNIMTVVTALGTVVVATLTFLVSVSDNRNRSFGV
ncbi:MAG: RNA polymerase sigma factor [Capsulimonadaceae bacterium]